MQTLFYIRTAEGQAAAYDTTSAMPRKLKSLLKVIDGKTSHEVFANSLRAFGDVQGLLTSLQNAGLIELSQDSFDPAQEAKSSSPTVSAPAQPGLVSTLAGKMGLRQTRVPNHSDGFAITRTVHTQPPTIFEQRLGASDRLQERQQDVQLLVQEMSSFVLAYVPEQAFGVLTELESINAMDQLAVLLGGYEQMVRHVGEPAHIHLIHVRQILGKWL